MKINNNYNLKNYNTFGINSIASRFIELENEKDIETYFTENKKKILILGGGSNVLLPDKIERDVLHINIKGIRIVERNAESIKIEVNAGENWHNFVSYCVQNKFYGLENLALIPGNVGSAPIQNIGAYGVEQDQFLHSVHGFDISKNRFVSLNNKDCEFSYRSSIFKKSLKGNFIITKVIYELPLIFNPNLNYKQLSSYIKANNLKINQKNIFESVIKIRQSKLPDPRKLGNSGSFFKNPIISKAKFESLKKEYNDLKGFDSNNGIKISAGWLIEKSGFKGIKNKNAGVYSKHALILVNYGNASAAEILDLSKSIIDKVEQNFGITLQPEVNIYT